MPVAGIDIFSLSRNDLQITFFLKGPFFLSFSHFGLSHWCLLQGIEGQQKAVRPHTKLDVLKRVVANIRRNAPPVPKVSRKPKCSFPNKILASVRRITTQCRDFEEHWQEKLDRLKQAPPRPVSPIADLDLGVCFETRFIEGVDTPRSPSLPIIEKDTPSNPSLLDSILAESTGVPRVVSSWGPGRDRWWNRRMLSNLSQSTERTDTFLLLPRFKATDADPTKKQSRYARRRQLARELKTANTC